MAAIKINVWVSEPSADGRVRLSVTGPHVTFSKTVHVDDLQHERERLVFAAAF